MPNLKYTWGEFKDDVPLLAAQVLKIQIPNLIISVTRGGAILGTTLSYCLDVPVVYFDPKKHIIDSLELNPKDNILIVDDINDTGFTLESINNQLIKAFPSNLTVLRDKNIRVESTRYLTIFNNKGSIFEVDYFIRPLDKRKDDVWILFP